MKHLTPFRPRPVLPLNVVEQAGWRLKNYAILADGRSYDETVASAASEEALRRLPEAGGLRDEEGNHGIGFQIVHFAEVGVVSPVFYWQWGSVLARLEQIRARWEDPTVFRDGVREVVGCIWEMDIVQFEVNLWTSTLLDGTEPPDVRLNRYLDRHTGSSCRS
ncbi:MAG: hypothetical protein AAGA19_05390 [Pseudomonadota bacterium]